MEDEDLALVEIARGPYRAQFIRLGASLHLLDAPDRHGKPANVVLGYKDRSEYRGHPRFYGAVAGRYANRIGGAKFSLDGVEYHLPKNNGENNLHSGPSGFDQADWTLEHHDGHSAVFTLISPSGTNGFPGNLHAEVHYELEHDGLRITFTATTDAATVVNLTDHAYFNLSGEASGTTILDHWLQIPASKFTPVDEHQIPSGVLQDVAGTPLDFRSPKRMGQDIDVQDFQLLQGRGYDNNFVVDSPEGPVRRVATAYDPASGRVLDVLSCQPGVQFYTGNHLAGGAPGTSGVTYPARGGFCLEPQKYPDSPNKPQFPSARLNPGERYTHKMKFAFRVARDEREAFGH